MNNRDPLTDKVSHIYSFSVLTFNLSIYGEWLGPKRSEKYDKTFPNIRR